jgi:hypothetical protein
MMGAMPFLKDEEPTPTLSPRVRELWEQHAQLNARTSRILEIVSGDLDWPDLDVELAEVDRLLGRHFALEEEGGYLHEVRDRVPSEAALLERLERAHGELTAMLRSLRRLTLDRHDAAAVRNALLDWLDLLGKHEAAENHLVKLASR